MSKWIMCSEQLPENKHPYESYLVAENDYEDCTFYEELTAKACDVYPDIDSEQILEFGCKYGRCGSCGQEWYDPFISISAFKNGEFEDSYGDVIAWMPLPELPTKEAWLKAKAESEDK